MKIAKNTTRVTLKYSVYDVTMITVNDEIKHNIIECDDIKSYMKDSHLISVDGKEVMADCVRYKALGDRKETYSVPLSAFITWVKFNGERVEKPADETDETENG